MAQVIPSHGGTPTRIAWKRSTTCQDIVFSPRTFTIIVVSLSSLMSVLSLILSACHTIPESIAEVVMVRLANNSEHRLCEQNQYADSLSLSLSRHGHLMDEWMEKKVEYERNLTKLTEGHPHDWNRFQAFQEMGSCNQTCIGGACRMDTSKITCGVGDGTMEAPCVVYSIGGNNQWEFELDILEKTPCEVHTFDCTGSIERFKKPDNKKLHFHHVCLGTQNKNDTVGEFWTLEKMQKTLNHDQIDLFKMDIEGYEWPLLESWPVLTDIRSSTTVLPMQILVEVHYQTQMPELSFSNRVDWKFSTDMIYLESKLLQMGYSVVVRDDNKQCAHCTELTLVRIRCPPPLL